MTMPFGTPASTNDDYRVLSATPIRTLGNGSPSGWLAPLDLDSELPETAVFTGFSTSNIELWLDDEQRHAFLTDGQTVERWPRVDPPPWCA